MHLIDIIEMLGEEEKYGIFVVFQKINRMGSAQQHQQIRSFRYVCSNENCYII